MAQSLDDAEFWLPPRFLTDDDVLMDKNNFHKNGGGGTGFGHSHDGFPSEFPYEFDSFSSNSALSSPVESVVGSTEAESSDEEEFLFGLTRRLAQSTLHDSQKLAATSFTLDKHEVSVSKFQWNSSIIMRFFFFIPFVVMLSLSYLNRFVDSDGVVRVSSVYSEWNRKLVC